MISMIVAVDDAGGIGKDGGIPWHFKEDMKYFARTTKNSTCIMGRKTYDSMIEVLGKRKNLLKGRQSIVISRNPDLDPVGAELVKSLSEALTVATREDVFIIGGEGIYREGLGLADRVYITRIPGYYRCDVHLTDLLEEVEYTFRMGFSRRSEKDHRLIHEWYQRSQNEI
jgi:dihydrofolate reductase